MALLTVQQIVAGGLDPDLVEPDELGDTFHLDDRTFLVVRNGSMGSINVVKKSYATAGAGLAKADQTVAVPAGEERWIDFAMSGFRNVADGTALATCSAQDDVLVAAVRA